MVILYKKSSSIATVGCMVLLYRPHVVAMHQSGYIVEQRTNGLLQMLRSFLSTKAMRSTSFASSSLQARTLARLCLSIFCFALHAYALSYGVYVACLELPIIYVKCHFRSSLS